jgi:hypothetical protein
MRRRLVGTALAALVACAGCSGSDGGRSGAALTGDEHVAAEALAGQLLDSGALSGYGAVARRQATCLGEGAVARLGLDRLQHYRVVTARLEPGRRLEEVRMTRPDAAALADVFLRCVDAERLFEEQLIGSVRAIDPQARRCIRQAVDADAARTVLRLTFQGRADRRSDEIRERLTACAAGRGGRAE